MYKNDKDKIFSYVIFPRYILEDYRNGLITKPEFIIYCYLRLSGNPYGKAYTSFENINNDMFSGKVSKNYINRVMLSLKNKEYLHYDSRKGRRGSFEVRFGDFLSPEGILISLDKYFKKGVTTPTHEEEKVDEEPSTSKELSEEEIGHRLDEIGTMFKGVNNKYTSGRVIGSYNNNDKYKNKNK